MNKRGTDGKFHIPQSLSDLIQFRTRLQCEIFKVCELSCFRRGSYIFFAVPFFFFNYSFFSIFKQHFLRKQNINFNALLTGYSVSLSQVQEYLIYGPQSGPYGLSGQLTVHDLPWNWVVRLFLANLVLRLYAKYLKVSFDS